MESPENFILSKSAFKICEKYRGLLVFSTVQVYSYPFQVKPKRYWLALLIRILKNAQHKWITVKILLLVGMDANNVWGLGITKWQGITMLLCIAQRSWTNLYS